MLQQTVLIPMPLEDLKAIIFKTVKEAVQKDANDKKDPFVNYPELLTRRQLADMLDIKSLATIDNWTRQGRLNKIRNGHIVRYKKSEVLKAFNALQKFQRG